VVEEQPRDAAEAEVGVGVEAVEVVRRKVNHTVSTVRQMNIRLKTVGLTPQRKGRSTVRQNLRLSVGRWICVLFVVRQDIGHRTARSVRSSLYGVRYGFVRAVCPEHM